MLIRNALTIVIALISLLLIWIFHEPLILALRWFSDFDAVVESIQGYGLWGPAVLFLLILVQLFIGFIPGHVLVAAGGYIYGAPLTIAIASVSSVLGAQLAFVLARKYGKPLVYRLASQRTIVKWEKIAGNRGPVFYFFTFVLPFIPSDMMCYVAGLGKISAGSFFVASLLGRLWSATETAVLGSYGFQPPIFVWILLAISLAGLYAGWRFYDRYFQMRSHERRTK